MIFHNNFHYFSVFPIYAANFSSDTYFWLSFIMALGMAGYITLYSKKKKLLVYKKIKTKIWMSFISKNIFLVIKTQ